jgi:hypothetical protein
VKKPIIILVIIAAIAGLCYGQGTNVEKPEAETGYVERLFDGGVEYRKGNVLYIFKDGALTTVIQLDWKNDEYGNSLSWDYIYSDTPKEIIYTSKSGDRSQSKTYLKITLEKTVYKYKYRSIDGWQTKEYEASTPLDIWIALAVSFSWDEFNGLISGPSAIPRDGSDKTITVATVSGTSSVTNYPSNELKKFFKEITDYLWSIEEKAK